MAHQAAGGGLALGGQSRFIRDNWLEKIQDFPRKNVSSMKAVEVLHRPVGRHISEMSLQITASI
jgi:hypothetical protein